MTLIAPLAGTEVLPVVPLDGTNKAKLRGFAVPQDGHHLDEPSPLLNYNSELEFKWRWLVGVGHSCIRLFNYAPNSLCPTVYSRPMVA